MWKTRSDRVGICHDKEVGADRSEGLRCEGSVSQHKSLSGSESVSVWAVGNNRKLK